jgi:hypothetical protein
VLESVRRGAIDNGGADDLQGQGHPRSNITVSAKMSGNARGVGLELTDDFRGSRQSQHNPKHRRRSQTCTHIIDLQILQFVSLTKVIQQIKQMNARPFSLMFIKILL